MKESTLRELEELEGKSKKGWRLDDVMFVNSDRKGVDDLPEEFLMVVMRDALPDLIKEIREKESRIKYSEQLATSRFKDLEKSEAKLKEVSYSRREALKDRQEYARCLSIVNVQLKEKEEEIERLRKALRNIIIYLGPTPIKCSCDGCDTEMRMSLQEAKEALKVK